MEEIRETLLQRGSQYGSFQTQAETTQAIKRVMHDAPNWELLPADMKESLEMAALKMGRILCGNPNLHDSWHDISGYITLVADRLAPQTGK